MHVHRSGRVQQWYRYGVLLARLVSAASRSPRAKRWLWRTWYQFLARRYRDPSWTFMNYGYRADPPLALAAEDENDRYCIQLYDAVAAGAPLAGREVLEVGSGRGGGAAFVARHHAPARMVAIDRSPRAVAFCQTRFDVPRLSFQAGDAEHLPFGDVSFDAVLNVESSHCYGRIADFFAEVRRVLRPNGRFLYADFRPRGDVDAWRAQLSAAGFRIEAELDLTPGIVAALDADDARKRSLIAQFVDRPLAGVFQQFAAVRGSALYEEMRAGALSYRAFTAART
jgi:ubiquinone/menaquinone biosynthesis C-methylase UbiE